MELKLSPLNLDDLMEIKNWRNKCLESLRTSGFTTELQQEQFYKNVICNKDSNLKYFGIRSSSFYSLMGCVGLDVQKENKLAEISLMISPELQKKGYGKLALDLILEYGFVDLDLENVFGEVYECNPAIDFWYKFCKKYKCYKTVLPMRKRWKGQYYNSLYFNLNIKNWRYKNVNK